MLSDGVIIELGKRILKIRKKLNISQAELARRSELSKNYLGELERGQLTNISVSIVVRLAEALGVAVCELFEGAEDVNATWEDDDTFTNALYQKQLEDSCYPPKFAGYKVTTLLQFLAYLPLLQPEILFDSLQRIAGDFVGNEEYVLKQINYCISRTPSSPAKEYAEKCAESLARDEYLKDGQGYGTSEEGYEEYVTKIKQLDAFYRYYRMMLENSI